ncbi:hypothetical protein [Pantoea dispersa]|uniref:hypothetical protein n=1 Tax=Pantoea dispersa TaxID=59814 RepID=UPI00133186A2|nr:hypothetical protein [Pantoea dispersa]KAF0856734.1 hypothetical protein Y788_04775 [Pantoea dispersa 625]
MAYLKIIGDDGDTVEIECPEDDIFQFLDMTALAKEHGLSKQVLYNRLARRMPLTVALKTSPRQYIKK